MRQTLLRASFGFLVRHPWQLAMAVLGIGLLQAFGRQLPDLLWHADGADRDVKYW